MTYFLDRASNRTAVVDTGVNKVYTPNILNQYTSAGGFAVTNGTEHQIASYDNVSYTYRNDERLIGVVSTNPTNNYQLAYDAFGRCVKRTLNNVTTYYIYDGEKPILEYKSDDLTHPAKSLYGKGIDEILMRTETGVNGSQAFYYQQDHEGNVTHLTNASGNVIERYRYDAFGAPTFYNGSGTQISATAYNNRFLFTGREYAATYRGTYIPAFAFYEYRARAYNPTLGRFMSEAPKGFDAGDYNFFRYCSNDPLDRADPMGLDTEVELRYYIMVRAYLPTSSGEAVKVEYGHQNLVLRDTETGKMMVERGMPSGKYTRTIRAALNLPQKDSSGKYQTLKADLMPVKDTNDPLSGQETRSVAGSKVVLKDSLDKVASKLDDVNAAINRSNITYRPLTENSNAVAGTGYNAVTDRQAPSSPQLPGSDIVFKLVYELGSNIPRVIPADLRTK